MLSLYTGNQHTAKERKFFHGYCHYESGFSETDRRTAMALTTVEAWAVPILFGADHTFVAQGDTQTDYFACWGQHFDPSPKQPICTGNINYNLANCYRDPLFGCPDTAGIGIYGVNGVCHQSANCFLFSAN